MGFFSKSSSHSQKTQLALVFDIGSSSVGAALFEMNAGTPHIVLSLREPILLEDKTDYDRFLELMTKALDTLTEKVSKAGLGAPRQIFAILSSPWYVSQTRIISMEKDAPFLFTQKFANSLIDKETTLFEQEYLAKYVHPKDKVRTIEVKNIKTVLNGYETVNPYNQRAKKFELTMFISISPEQVLNKIEETIKKHFHVRQVKFASFVMASFVVARDIFAHQENFLLIDLGGEVTDISMIKKSTLRESISFPMGANFMIRGVATGMKSTIEEAKSFLSLYRDGHAVGGVAKNLDPVINNLKSTWLSKFQESLANLSSDISIPSNIFLAIDKEFADFFAQIIKTEQFNQYTLTDSKFNISFLGTEALAGITTFGEGVDRDPFTIIEAIYINRIFN